MSWIRQSQRKETRWLVASIPSKAVRTCPLVSLVGACCSGCAHGGSCTGEDELRIQMGRQMTGGLPGLVEEGRAWDSVESTQADISKLGADIVVKAPALVPEYDAFVRDWGVWFAANKDRRWYEDLAFAPHIISGAVLDQYKALVARYTAIRDKLVAMGVTPTAPETDTLPIDKVLDSVGQGAADALGGIAKVGVYVAVGLGAAALLWVAAPLLLRRVLA